MQGLFYQAGAHPPLSAGWRLVTAHKPLSVPAGCKCIFNGAPQTAARSATRSATLSSQQKSLFSRSKKRSQKKKKKRSDEGDYHRESEFHVVIILL